MVDLFAAVAVVAEAVGAGSCVLADLVLAAAVFYSVSYCSLFSEESRDAFFLPSPLLYPFLKKFKVILTTFFYLFDYK